MADESILDRLAKAREAKEKKDRAAKAAAESRELEVLELEMRLDAELGPRGMAYEIIDTVEGPVAVKLGEAVLHTRFQSGKVDDASIHNYVFPCVVHPTKEKYLDVVARRPHIAARCAGALATLYGVKADEDAGKY